MICQGRGFAVEDFEINTQNLNGFWASHKQVEIGSQLFTQCKHSMLKLLAK